MDMGRQTVKCTNTGFANLTVELLAKRRGPKVQFEGMHIGVKVEKPKNYNGSKGHDVDTLLFEVQEHLDLTVIPKWGHFLYAASLLHGNVALQWRELCERNHHHRN